MLLGEKYHKKFIISLIINVFNQYKLLIKVQNTQNTTLKWTLIIKIKKIFDFLYEKHCDFFYNLYQISDILSK